jgi:hypothetical protein
MRGAILAVACPVSAEAHAYLRRAAPMSAGELTMPTEPKKITRAEQENLLRIARLRRDGAIADTKCRIAEAVADHEMRMAAEFSYDQREIWVELMHTAKARVSELDSQLAEDCRRLGIPEAFRPSIDLYWSGRGENASSARRAELRRVMVTRLAAMERAALETIDAGYRQHATAILSATITSSEALALLDAMPTIEQLLPEIDYDAVKRSLLAGPEAAILRRALALTDESDDGDV